MDKRASVNDFCERSDPGELKGANPRAKRAWRTFLWRAPRARRLFPCERNDIKHKEDYLAHRATPCRKLVTRSAFRLGKRI